MHSLQEFLLKLFIPRTLNSIEHSENLVRNQMTSQPLNKVQPLPEWKYHEEDFAYNPEDIFSEDSEEISKFKEIISNKLSVCEREIFLLYTHNNSNYRKLSKLLGCSPTTARTKVCQIRNKILSYYNNVNHSI